jgi:hypothetical protein
MSQIILHKTTIIYNYQIIPGNVFVNLLNIEIGGPSPVIRILTPPFTVFHHKIS